MRLGVVVALAFVVACGGHPPRRHVDRGAVETGHRPYARPSPPVLRILVPAPNGLAWPLTVPPSVMPNYRSVAFAWPGVCEQRGVLPDDVLAYIEAWCAYAKHADFDLPRALAKLRATQVPRLGDAIVLDLANLAADGHGSDVVPWDAELQEAILAIEIELGRLDDATDVARAYLQYVKARRMTSCGSDLVAWMFDFQPDAIAMLPGQIRMYGRSSCGMQLEKLGCIIWNGSGRGATPECDGVLLDEDERAMSSAVAARLRWTPLATPDELVEIGRLAAAGLVLPDAEDLAITALRQALAGSCSVLDEARDILSGINQNPRKQERFDQARAEILAMTPERCEEYRARQIGR